MLSLICNTLTTRDQIMSIIYSLFKFGARHTGYKKFWEEPDDVLLPACKEINKKRPIPELHDKEIMIFQEEIGGFPVLKMTHKEKKKAVLYLIGGGMVKRPQKYVIKQALSMTKETDKDFYIPYYPLCTDYEIGRAFTMVYETYKVMLERYAPEDITVFGTSAGASLAMGVVAYINHFKLDTPMPGQIIAMSVGTCPANEEERKAAYELDKIDLLLPAKYLDTSVETKLNKESKYPYFVLHTQTGDYTNCPKVYFIYGEDETLRALLPTFEKAMQKYNVPYEVKIGPGMFHCYPMFPFCKETKKAYKEILKLLKSL